MQLINAYRITPDGNLPIDSQANSLDELTPQLPAGFYTTFRTYDNGRRVLGLEAHLGRLYQPIEWEKIQPEVSEEYLRSQLRILSGNISSEFRIRLVMTKNGAVFVATTPLKTLPPEYYQNGVKVITTEGQRDNPRLKSTSFISASKKERAEITQSAVFEALLARNGAILEGITSNIFYVRDRVLGTARKNILLGITRRTVLRVARGSGLEIVYRPLKREQVPTLSEAFLTSSSRGIVPIIQIDDTPVGEGAPGPVTKKLIDGYRTYVVQHAELI